ncbi:hypothetical protein [Mariniphaga sp.]
MKAQKSASLETASSFLPDIIVVTAENGKTIFYQENQIIFTANNF